ncbi:transposase-like protein [Pedobacter sp. UYP1]
MATQDEFDFESFKKEAISGLDSGKKMTGADGVLAPMMKHFLESMMAGELDHYLSESKILEQPNRKNGKSKKTVRSLSSGEFELETSRDRLSRFEPKIVPKRQLIITEEPEGNILSMYAMGMSTRGMRDYIQEMYAMDISPAEISQITDSVLPAVQEW